MRAENEEFAKRLNLAMKMLDMNPVMLSLKTGMSPRMIRNYRKGQYQPGAYSVKLIAKALGVSIDWLLGIEDDAKEGKKDD